MVPSIVAKFGPESCAHHVLRDLEGLSGVVHAEVALANNEATVEHLPAFMDEAALVAAVRDAGYPARVNGTREDVGRSSALKELVTSCGCGCCGPGRPRTGTVTDRMG